MRETRNKIKTEKSYTDDIIRYYVMFDKGGKETVICKSIWQYYHRLNCERIWASENEERIAAFDSVSNAVGEKESYNIFELFYDILFVETGLKRESKEYKTCMKALGKALKKNKLNSVMSVNELLKK